MRPRCVLGGWLGLSLPLGLFLSRFIAAGQWRTQPPSPPLHILGLLNRMKRSEGDDGRHSPSAPIQRHYFSRRSRWWQYFS